MVTVKTTLVVQLRKLVNEQLRCSSLGEEGRKEQGALLQIRLIELQPQRKFLLLLLK